MATLPKILPLRARAEVQNRWLKARLALLPELMRREGFDLWIICAREYNEDPVLWSLLPAPMLSARRRTILVFYQNGARFEALSVAPPGVGLDGFYQSAWAKPRESAAPEDEWQCLARLVAERDPARIGINVSTTFAFGDGLSASEHQAMLAALGPYAARCTSAERLAVSWLERRLPEEIEAAVGINAIAHGIIAEAFSSRVVHVGVTSALELAWWIRERIAALGLEAWFQPTVSLQRRGAKLGDIGLTPDEVIRPGDLLHCDVGIKYLGLATDTQQHAYALRLGESAPPAGLARALAIGNRLQDIVAGEFAAGLSGNEVLRRARQRAAAEGIVGRIYSHPIGYHGHGAGPLIGLYDNQESVPGRGDYPLHDDTLYALELYVESQVPEWEGQQVKIALEQTVAFTGGQVHYLAGRQTALHVI